MNWELIIGALVSAVAMIVVWAPFFWGPRGELSVGYSIKDPDQLRRAKELILSRYLADEEQFKNKSISAREWSARREFLQRRYIDMAKRLDFVGH